MMKKLLTFIMMAFALSACHKAQESSSFVNKEYRLLDMPNGALVTLGFDGKTQQFFGKSAVNRYFGSYTLEDNKLTLTPTGSTMMLGPKEFMQVEQDYLRKLPLVEGFEFVDGKLVLVTKDDQKLIFVEIDDVPQPQKKEDKKSQEEPAKDSEASAK